MIVLHGTWKPPETLKDGGNFFIWGESSVLPVKPSNTQEELLSDFLNSAIDSCIRNWIPISEVRSKKPGLSEALLESLASGKPIKARVSNLK